MRPLGIAMVLAGMVFLLSGVAATTWAVSQADAMSAEDRALDPEQYDFYVSAQSCCMGCAAIGLVILAVGILIGGRSGSTAKKEQGLERANLSGPSDR